MEAQEAIDRAFKHIYNYCGDKNPKELEEASILLRGQNNNAAAPISVRAKAAALIGDVAMHRGDLTTAWAYWEEALFKNPKAGGGGEYGFEQMRKAAEEHTSLQSKWQQVMADWRKFTDQ